MKLHFGEALKQQSQVKGVNPSQLASLIGRTSQAVYADLRKPDLNTEVIGQYLDALEITFSDLINNNLEPSSIEYISKEDLQKELKETKEKLELFKSIVEKQERFITHQANLIEAMQKEQV